MAKDRKIVAFRKLADTIPAQVVNGKHVEGRLEDLQYTREEAMEYAVGQADRNAQKFAKSGETRRGPETHAAHDAWMDVAFDLQQGLGKDVPVDLAVEFEKQYGKRYSPEGKSMFDPAEALQELLAMPPPAEAANSMEA